MGERAPRGPSDVYRPIADYAIVGNTHTAALVASNGSIDWCCLPHFDSGALFCRLLDAERGGYFRIAPAGRCTATRRFVDGSAVLATEFATDAGRVVLTDCLHTQRIATSRLGQEDPACHRLVRRVEGIEGTVEVALAIVPTFDYARRPVRFERSGDEVLARSDGEQILIRTEPPVRFDEQGGALSARIAVGRGDHVWVELDWADRSTGTAALARREPDALIAETVRNWNEWSALCTYEGPYRDLVRQSARVLKLLTFGPTGALVAAPTTSLPAELGGVRNWDYRFTWLRDSSLILHALMSLGYHEAAMDFFSWLERLCVGQCGQCDALQIMYRLDGSPDLPEQELSQLAGYRGSTPVRVGNAAAHQTQLDVYGHVLDAALLCHEWARAPRPALRRVLSHLADQAASRWREPDHGIWEVRGPARHFVSSKLLCWVALDRAVRLREASELAGDVVRWRRERDAIRVAIVEAGYDQKSGAFVQSFRTLDASALLIPLVGFLPAADPRVSSTMDRIRERLTSHGLVHRYLTDDGLPGSDATFALASFWMVENLALVGRIDEARMLFEHITSFASDLGLLAEEIDPVSRELLGNYPQGFTHLALIEAALTIARAERGDSQPATAGFHAD